MRQCAREDTTHCSRGVAFVSVSAIESLPSLPYVRLLFLAVGLRRRDFFLLFPEPSREMRGNGGVESNCFRKAQHEAAGGVERNCLLGAEFWCGPRGPAQELLSEGPAVLKNCR